MRALNHAAAPKGAASLLVLGLVSGGQQILNPYWVSMPTTELRWWRAYHRDGNVRVYVVELSPDARREEEAAAWLDASERERLRKFAFAGPRRRFTLCRAALRALLCTDLNCSNHELSFAETEYGKPFALVNGAPTLLSFNVSHATANGMIALAPKQRVGVDIEEYDPDRRLDTLIDSVLAEKERSALRNRPGPQRMRLFFRLWAIKEALLKACGLGFHLDPSDFTVPHAMLRGGKVGTLRLPQEPEVDWKVVDLGSAHFAAAVAYAAESTPESGTPVAQ